MHERAIVPAAAVREVKAGTQRVRWWCGSPAGSADPVHSGPFVQDLGFSASREVVMGCSVWPASCHTAAKATKPRGSQAMQSLANSAHAKGPVLAVKPLLAFT